MTTIAYRNGVIAIDSRISTNNLIYDDDFKKSFYVRKHWFFYCGNITLADEFIERYFTETEDEETDYAAYVVTPSGLVYEVDAVDKKLSKFLTNPKKFYALGSGRDFALGAMSMGASAYKAVEIAKLHDPRSGGKIRSHKV